MSREFDTSGKALGVDTIYKLRAQEFDCGVSSKPSAVQAYENCDSCGETKKVRHPCPHCGYRDN